MSQPRIVELEQSEVSDTITLNTLQRAAEALGCRLVYALVPERPLAEIVQSAPAYCRDRQLAAIEHTMRLEDQAVNEQEVSTNSSTGGSTNCAPPGPALG